MGLAQAGVNQLIDLVDNTASKSLDAIQEVEDAAVATGHGVINVGDKTFDAALDEVREVQSRLVSLLRNIASTVTAPLP